MAGQGTSLSRTIVPIGDMQNARPEPIRTVQAVPTAPTGYGSIHIQRTHGMSLLTCECIFPIVQGLRI